MPDVTLSYRAAMYLRRFPIAHRPLRWMRRHAWPRLGRLLLGLLRPVTSGWTRFGPPAGLFSVRDLITRGELEGRIILEDQGKQDMPERSLQVLARMVQHESQPWPVVWSRHRNARLVTSSLA